MAEDKKEVDPKKAIKRMEKNSSLIDILIQIEDFLDNLDLYAFKNWFNAEVVDGPYIKRYWVFITLRWEYDEMPDPQGAVRLLHHNTKVKFYKQTEEEPIEVKSPSDFEDFHAKKPKKEKIKKWYVEIQIPKRFIENNFDDLELYSDDINIDNVEDARDKGIDSKDTYVDEKKSKE